MGAWESMDTHTHSTDIRMRELTISSTVTEMGAWEDKDTHYIHKILISE